MKENPPSIRVFFGIPVSDDLVQPYIKLLLKEYPEMKRQVRWTLPGNHHVTVRFLGSIEEAKLERLIELVKETVVGIGPFDLELRLITPFPVKHGDLSAITIQASRELQSLHDAVSIAASHIDFKEESRPYMPHITLFRSKENLKGHFEKIELEDSHIQAQEMVLYQSIPTERGSVYKIIHQFPFS